VSEDEIFGPKRSLARAGTSEGGINWTAFSQLKQGDLVVHQDHGIGRFGGLVKMEIEQKVNDFVIIEYTGNDRLYVPADRISILQKYIGADEKDPKLDQLGAVPGMWPRKRPGSPSGKSPNTWWNSMPSENTAKGTPTRDPTNLPGV
jgi:transcription-repair coupling factor (superfamily II helicase)